MKILIVEDQDDKRQQLKECVIGALSGNVNIVDKESLRGALKEVVTCVDYDLMILDMSMPNFDSSEGSIADSSPESFAGKELLEQMKLRGILIPVIVVTQYSSFEGGAVSLDQLSSDFESEFDEFYLGSIYYNSAEDSWKKKLISHLGAIDGQKS